MQTRIFDSFVFKYHHNDFEDDLMLGVANRIDADYVVTEDKNLIKHTNGVCINVQQALKLVEGSNVPSARPSNLLYLDKVAFPLPLADDARALGVFDWFMHVKSGNIQGACLTV